MIKIIKFENVSFAYKCYTNENNEMEKQTTIKNINLEIQHGEFITILGNNGSGKSTLVKLMNALIKPTTGKIFVDGIDTCDDKKIWDIRKKVGIVFQNPDNQIISSTVEDDVAFGLENLCLAPQEISKKVESSLKQINMLEYRKFSPQFLSGGQKQKVAICGILAMQPDYIIFDEATSMIDPLSKKSILQIIKMLNQENNLTIIMITHDIKEALLSERILVLENGRIICDENPSNIFNVCGPKIEQTYAYKVANHLKSHFHFEGNVLDNDSLVQKLSDVINKKTVGDKND